MSQDSIVVFRSYIQALEKLPAELYKEVSQAIYAYALDGIEPSDEVSPIAQAMFISLKSQMDYNIARYEKAKENGSKGGAPKGSRNNPNGRRGKVNSELTETNQELTENKPKTKGKTAKRGGNGLDKTNQELTDGKLKELTEGEKLTPMYNVKSINNIVVVDVDNSAHTRESENEKFLGEFFAENKRAQIEVLCMQLHTTPEKLQEEAREVIAEWELTETHHEDYKDQAQHLINQLRIKYNAKLREANNGTARQQAKGATGTTGAPAQKGGYSSVCTDTPPKKRRKSTI